MKCVPVFFFLLSIHKIRAFLFLLLSCDLLGCIMSCLKCNVLIQETSDKFVSCDGCSRHVHVSCSELSDNEIKCLTLRTKTKRRIKYICIECEQGVHQIPKLISLINDLKNEIRDMRVKYEELTNDSVNRSGGSFHMVCAEEIINEIQERNKRSQNIIIYGSLEEGASRQDQVQMDTGTVQSILTHVGVTCSEIRPVRLGKFDSTRQIRKRPIRVRLSSSEDVHRVLRKSARDRIRTSTQFSHLYVSPDRTPKQVELFRSVKLDLDERIAKGEANLRIKYLNGVPTISQSRAEN